MWLQSKFLKFAGIRNKAETSYWLKCLCNFFLFNKCLVYSKVMLKLAKAGGYGDSCLTLKNKLNGQVHKIKYFIRSHRNSKLFLNCIPNKDCLRRLLELASGWNCDVFILYICTVKFNNGYLLFTYLRRSRLTDALPYFNCCFQ